MRDKIHNIVRRALQKNGWKITSDPFYLPLEGTTVEIDLEAEKSDENRNVKIIFVEIKTISRSLVYDFYTAYGQYDFYRSNLIKEGILHPIFLAISTEVYENIQYIPALSKWIIEHQINLLIVDLQHENIEQWIQY